MLRSLEDLEFIKSHADSLEIQMGAQGKVIEMSFYLQAFQLEERIESSKNMIILGHNAANSASQSIETLALDMLHP